MLEKIKENTINFLKPIIQFQVYDLSKNNEEFKKELVLLRTTLITHLTNRSHKSGNDSFDALAENFTKPEMYGKIPVGEEKLTVGDLRICILEAINILIEEHVSDTLKTGLSLTNDWDHEDIKKQLSKYIDDTHLLNQDKNTYATQEYDPEGNEYQKQAELLGFSWDDTRHENFGRHIIEKYYELIDEGKSEKEAITSLKVDIHGEPNNILGNNNDNQQNLEEPHVEHINALPNGAPPQDLNNLDLTDIQQQGIDLGFTIEQVKLDSFGEHTIEAFYSLLDGEISPEDIIAIIVNLTDIQLRDMLKNNNDNHRNLDEVNVENINALPHEVPAQDFNDLNLSDMQLEGLALGFTIEQVTLDSFGRHTINAVAPLLRKGQDFESFAETLANLSIDIIDPAVEVLGSHPE